MIAIIGGGPAGIALAVALDRVGVDWELLEKNSLAHTWRSAPRDLRVLSPWWTNVLDWRSALKGNPFRKAYAGEYVDHLLKIAEGLKGTIREESAVSKIRFEKGSWWLEVNQEERGPYTFLVLATGYFANPKNSDSITENDGSIPMLHAASIVDYGMLERLRQKNRPVVVIGRRVTAGQLIEELDKRNIPSVLSVRAPVEFRRHGFLASIREFIYFFWEEISSLVKPVRRDSYPIMEGGRVSKLVENETVKVVSLVRKIEQGSIIFEDGTKMPAAAVVHATGYSPALDFLPKNIKSDEWGVPRQVNFELEKFPGVFLIGFDNIYDHRSRYLRGIRLDASRLARRLKIKLSNSERT